MGQSQILDQATKAYHWSRASTANSLVSILVLLASYLVLSLVLYRPAFLSIPGPFAAKFTDLWLARQAMRGNRSLVVHEQHKKYGKFVRIAPNHISIADPAALNQVYGHSTGTLKADFYDAFAAPGFPRGLFNTRSRPEHTRKRKIVSHTFAPKSITAFEPFIRREIQTMCARFDGFAKEASISRSSNGKDDKKWHQLDMLSWLNFFAFDSIASLAFGSTFGMLEQGRDDADVDLVQPDGSIKTTNCNAIQIINERGEYAGTMGCVPPWMRPMVKKIPWFATRLTSVRKLSGIALSRVNYRLQNGSDRDDLLSKLQGAKDEKGEPMGKMELTAEALTQLIAGSDTTSNSSTAVLYHLLTHPQYLQKLQAELDASLSNTVGEEVPLLSDVQDLPYLNAVLQESLRYHATSSMGLPRLVPDEGTTVCGKHFPGGTVLSVPAYTIQRDVEIWGQDAEQYNPERWLNDEEDEPSEKAVLREKSFVPFSVGPRACVGRNVAMMELQLLMSTLVHRYEFQLVDPKFQMETVEGFLRKPVELPVLMRRRN